MTRLQAARVLVRAVGSLVTLLVTGVALALEVSLSSLLALVVILILEIGVLLAALTVGVAGVGTVNGTSLAL